MAPRPLRIAIVDDNPEDRATIRRQLAHGDELYRFVEYDGSEDVLRELLVHPPDCLLLDYDLKGTDGLHLLEQLGGTAGATPFPVIVLTGRGSEQLAVRALKRGAVDYIAKGTSTPATLMTTVAEAVAKFAQRPLIERQRGERERAHRLAGEQSRGRERLVLIVDDSPEDREATRRALRRSEGGAYRFVEESTAAEGLALCRSAGLDCLILDYSLPDANGLEFLRELTGGTGITPFPVVMLTGRGDEAIAVEALKCGAMDYLVKGRFGPDALRATVEQSVARMGERRAREEQRILVLERLEAESRERADALAEADRRKDEFLAMLAHELRNPLAPITNALHVLRLLGQREEPASSALDIASRQLGHLSRLVDDLMEVSRITRGKIALKREPVDLAPLLRRAVDAAQPLVGQKRHVLAVALPDAPIVLDADPTRVEQIFTNLLNNAAKYTDPGGRIEVFAVRDGGDAVVTVRDTGVGIDRDTLPHVFDLFAQSTRSIDRALGGLGVGLTLVRALTEQHGGTVEARSEGPGKGSTFVVRLPVSASAMPAADTEVVPAQGAPLNVLVVDDNIDGAETFAMLFRAWGHAVHTAYDGIAGLEAARRLAPDVVLLDIGLPGMNGYDVARAILATSGDDPPLLVAVTGYGQAEDRRRTEAAGFRHHLVKPVHPDVLARLLATARARQRAAVTPPA